MKSVKIVLVMFLLMGSALSGFSAVDETQTVSFNFKGTLHRVTVQISSDDPEKADILLTGPKNTLLNLSAQLPGNNVAPVVSVSPDNERYTISWFQDHFGNKQLCVYDSQSGLSRKLQLDSYKTAYPLEVVYYEGWPLLMLFKGNNSDNTDIYYYHLERGEIVNITHSPDQNMTCRISDEGNRVFIETESLHHHYRYRLRKRDLNIKLTKSVPLRQEQLERSIVKSDRTVNTIAGFGDSITWGTIRMDPEFPEDEEHPEWAYLAKLENMLESQYGEVYTENLGYPGDTSYDGVDRMEDAFDRVDAFFCIVLFGTNDVAESKFDVDETIANLFYILSHLIDDYGMYPIISTIPPQKNEKKFPAGQQVYVLNTILLNSRIKIMARDMGIPMVDSHHMFFNSGEYWEELLEVYKGNHPSPTGHQVLAELFMEKILAVPPAVPQQFYETEHTTDAITLQWEYNKEFDFSHYEIQWGYSQDNLDKTETVTASFYRFVPDKTDETYDNAIYFRIQAVDQDGNGSGFTEVSALQY